MVGADLNMSVDSNNMAPQTDEASASSMLNNMTTGPQSPSLLVNGSVSLKDQMLARSAGAPQNQQMARQQMQQPAALGGMSSSGSRPQLDADVLSRMVAAQGRAGAGSSMVPVRVASMQDFRRSMNKLSAVPESSMGAGGGGMHRAMASNQAFDLSGRAGGGRLPPIPQGDRVRPMSSGNPLLKMMEARMASSSSNHAGASAAGGAGGSNQQQQMAAPPSQASSPSPPLPSMSNGDKAALQASISKWAGISNRAASFDQGEEKKNNDAQQASPSLHPVAADRSTPDQTSSGQASPSGRVPLSPNQIQLLKELTGSQTSGVEGPSQTELLQQRLLQQQLLMGGGGFGGGPSLPLTARYQPVSSLSPAAAAQQQQQAMPAPAYPGLTRCAMSLAEVDRLRRENQSVQLLQQRAMQEREQAQAYMLQRSAAQAALSSSSTQDQFGLARGLQSSSELNSLHSGSYRKQKRRSSPMDYDDDSVCSGSTNQTQSITSSTSSHKIHRSLSHCSARAALTGSMENLRIRSQANFLNKASMRNQSFSSGLDGSGHGARNQSLSPSGGVGSMKNQTFQSFSSGSNSLSQHQLSSLGSRGGGGGSQHHLYQQRRQQQATLRRNTSSNNWVRSLLSEQSTAGKAAETFEKALQSSSSNLHTLTRKNQQQQQQPEEDHAANDDAPAEQEGLVSHKPIQVQAEEYAAPTIARQTSASAETIIISALPDRIKYQDAKADKKPLDVVKEALASRDLKPDTKPSMDMDDGFFFKVTEMYDQDIVNAIRSNDVDGLRRLHSGGTSLQCGNRFGETLIHLACRRAGRDVVSFLVSEAGVSLCVRDDYGRTPMHDACWRAEPDLELLDMLLDRAPQLLMLSDKRGHTPLDYARREHWAVLVPFLMERTDKFQPVC